MTTTREQGAETPNSRSLLQPKLVELIAGLRRHQVEEAVHLLLNYVDLANQKAKVQGPNTMPAETSTSEPTVSEPVLQVGEARRLIGLEASWEIDALAELVTSMSEDLGIGEHDKTDLTQLSFQLRGQISRIKQLNLVLMSILDNDGETTNLEKKVFGRVVTREGAPT